MRTLDQKLSRLSITEFIARKVQADGIFGRIDQDIICALLSEAVEDIHTKFGSPEVRFIVGD